MIPATFRIWCVVILNNGAVPIENLLFSMDTEFPMIDISIIVSLKTLPVLILMVFAILHHFLTDLCTPNLLPDANYKSNAEKYLLKLVKPYIFPTLKVFTNKNFKMVYFLGASVRINITKAIRQSLLVIPTFWY